MEEVNTIIERFPDEWPDLVRVCLYTGGQRLGDLAALLKTYGIIREMPGEVRGDRHRLSEKSFHSLRATAVTVLRLAGVSPDL